MSRITVSPQSLAGHIAALGETPVSFAMHATEATGEQVTAQLIKSACDGQPIALKKAQAICEYLAQEFGRPVRPADLVGLKLH